MSERIEIDLDAIERTALAATPGPWSCSEVIGGRGHGFCAQVWDSNGDALFTHESMEPQANADVGYCQVANPVVILELVRRLREAEKDAARYAFLRDNTYCSLSLSRNVDHSCNYVTAKQWIEEFETGEAWDDVPSDELQRMKDTNTIWALQIYPSTPIGFNRWSRSTLSAAIDAAMEEPK